MTTPLDTPPLDTPALSDPSLSDPSLSDSSLSAPALSDPSLSTPSLGDRIRDNADKADNAVIDINHFIQDLEFQRICAKNPTTDQRAALLHLTLHPRSNAMYKQRVVIEPNNYNVYVSEQEIIVDIRVSQKDDMMSHISPVMCVDGNVSDIVMTNMQIVLDGTVFGDTTEPIPLVRRYLDSTTVIRLVYSANDANRHIFASPSSYCVLEYVAILLQLSYRSELRNAHTLIYANQPIRVASQPLEPQPLAPQPSAPQPSAPQPSAPQPLAPQPSAPQPSAPQPSAPQPSALRPVAPQPLTPRPNGHYTQIINGNTLYIRESRTCDIRSLVFETLDLDTMETKPNAVHCVELIIGSQRAGYFKNVDGKVSIESLPLYAMQFVEVRVIIHTSDIPLEPHDVVVARYQCDEPDPETYAKYLAGGRLGYLDGVLFHGMYGKDAKK